MIWWRDDDAREPTPALDRLLQIARGRPLALAVVPDANLGPLAHRLAQTWGVCVGQHGIDHVNRSPPGQRRSEYAGEAGLNTMAAAIAIGRRRFIDVGLEPVFYTPPWNAGETHLNAALRLSGFTRLSAGSEVRADAGLSYAATDVDILRWKGAPRFRGGMKTLSALGKALRARRLTEDWERPIGLLTHHLAHDEAAWRFLAWMLAFADRRFAWTAMREG